MAPPPSDGGFAYGWSVRADKRPAKVGCAAYRAPTGGARPPKRLRLRPAPAATGAERRYDAALLGGHDGQKRQFARAQL